MRRFNYLMNIVELKTDEMLGKRPNIILTEGACIAGGAIRKWFTGKEKDSDVDIFFKDKTSHEKFLENTCANAEKLCETNNAETYKKDGIVIQCIKIKYYNSISELFDSFDFACCQFAYMNNTIYSTKEAILSTLRNHLAIHKIQKGFELDSLRRAFKYKEKGFEPCWGTLKALGESFREITPEDLNNQTEISPSGGKRLVRYD